MMGTTGGTVLLIVTVIFAGLLGVGAGGLTCLMLRQSWGLKTALIDAVLATIVAIASAYVVASIEAARGVWGAWGIGLVLAIAAASATVRHLVQSALGN